ncbi:MAG: 5-formyltetrahydrofolate cyclo-ligase [Natronospirillum sp.]
MSDCTANRQHIRQVKRRTRRALSAQQQTAAARRFARLAVQHPLIQHARHIALYLPNDGELDPRPLMRNLWQRGHICYLPVLSKTRYRQLVFRPYYPHSLLSPNYLGIPEPRAVKTVTGAALDAVLMPLVAFDEQGNRLGMGGGFYDRTFAQRWCRPHLIGVAHAFQAEAALPYASWDVPLRAVVTDRRTHTFRPFTIHGAPSICRQ